MKKIIMLFTYLSVFSVLSAGCSAGERRTETDGIRSGNPVIQKQTENKAAEESEGTAGAGISAAAEPTVSSEEKTVAYEGTIPFHYIAASKDGLFLSARDQGEGSFLLRMKTGEGGAEKLPVKAPEGMGMFACVGAGTDSDLILYGSGAGIFAYDLGEKEVKRHIPAAELPFPMDSGCKSTVLPDGRMLFAERGIVTKDGQILSTAEGTTFYYIPFGQ